MKFSIVFLAVLPAFFSAIDANLGPSHPIHSAPKPVVHHSAPKPVVHHTAPKPAPKPVVHHQPTVPKLPKKVPIPQPRPKIPTKPKTVTKPKVPSHPVTKPKVPTHQATKPKVPTHQATKPKVPTHPVTKPKVPTHPAAKPKVPTHPATKPKVPTHPAKNPKTPTHPNTNPKTPTHPNTNPKTPVKPPVKTPPKTQPNPQTQPKVTTKGHDAIADHARSMIGTPYSWGGGSLKGKSYGVERGAKTLGFDCSGLARYSVYQATGKTIARTAAAQFADKQCQHVPFAQRRAGDLVFFNDGGRIHHVAIVSGDGSKMIHAPQTGDHVKESPIRMKGHMSEVARC